MAQPCHCELRWGVSLVMCWCVATLMRDGTIKLRPAQQDLIQVNMNFVFASVQLKLENVDVYSKQFKSFIYQFCITIVKWIHLCFQGQFVTQTCFQGRFGEETGSDQFGGHILIHAPKKNNQIATARLSNVELTYVGQAFRLGRYPIHFHLNGNQSNSYVMCCAIHKSFNRAVNIHGSHYILVKNNVAYNIMGGAMFLEDGIEIGKSVKD